MTSTLLQAAELIFKRNLGLHKLLLLTTLFRKWPDSIPSLVRSTEKCTKVGKNYKLAESILLFLQMLVKRSISH